MAAIGIVTGLARASMALVESEEVGIVGVSEATFPAIHTFREIVGADEADLVRVSNGSFELRSSSVIGGYAATAIFSTGFLEPL
jgi:hypothetical protein